VAFIAALCSGEQNDHVGDHRAQSGGQCPLGPDDIAIQAIGERAGLGAGEERDRHALDVIEQR